MEEDLGQKTSEGHTGKEVTLGGGKGWSKKVVLVEGSTILSRDTEEVTRTARS